MRIAAFYFIHYAAIGILIPYMPAYFRAHEYSGKMIAVIASISSVASIFIPPVWGFLADRTRRPTLLMKLACFGGFAAFSPLLCTTRFAAVIAILAAYALFSTTVIPLADTVAVSEARRLGVDWARIRLWGSVGFIASSFGFGRYMEAGGPLEHTIPAILLVLGAGAAVSLLVRPPSSPASRAAPSFADAKTLASDPAFLLFLVAGGLHWAASSPYYMFFAAHLEGLKIAPGFVGAGFGLGVMAEVAMMWSFGAVRSRVPLFLLIGASFVLSGARWLLVSAADTGPALAAIQLFHAFTFGAFYVGSIAHLERAVPAGLLGTGRALFASVTMGLGGILGNAVAGVAFDAGGSASAFRIAASLEIVAPIFLLISAKLYAKRAAAGS